MTIMDIPAEASVSPAPPGAVPGAVLHDQVADLLHELDQHPAPVIAGELADAGYRGVPGTVMHPVARWLVAQLAGRQALADLDSPTAWVLPAGLHVVAADGTAALVPLPPAVAQLAAEFDAGEYPELVLPSAQPVSMWVRMDDAPEGHVCDAQCHRYSVPAPAATDGLTRCSECLCTSITQCDGGCEWATQDDIAAVGLDPAAVHGDVCTACLDMLVAAADAQARAAAEAALPPVPAEDVVTPAEALADPCDGRLAEVDAEALADLHEDAWAAQEVLPATGRVTPPGSHTAQLPIVPARDAGRVLVRLALLVAVAALAVAVAVTGRPVTGAVVALLLAGVELVLAVRRREGEGPPGKHRAETTGARRAGVAHG